MTNTLHDRQTIALEALVNWCWNTHKHLNKARWIKLYKAHNNISWIAHTNILIHRMQQELSKAEPDTLELVSDESSTWPEIDPGTFLDAIPDES